MEEAAVAAARPVADLPRLEHRDPQPGIALEQGQRGPDSRVSASDDSNVDVERLRERRCDRLGPVSTRLLEPPRRTREKRWSQALGSHRPTLRRLRLPATGKHRLMRVMFALYWLMILGGLALWIGVGAVVT